MTAFQAAVDRLFADPSLGVDALYRPVGAGDGLSVRVIARQPDQVVGFGEARLHLESSMFDVRMSEVSEPKAGDTLTLGGDTFVVQGEPTRDRERLIWTLDARPE